MSFNHGCRESGGAVRRSCAEIESGPLALLGRALSVLASCPMYVCMYVRMYVCMYVCNFSYGLFSLQSPWPLWPVRQHHRLAEDLSEWLECLRWCRAYKLGGDAVQQHGLGDV